MPNVTITAEVHGVEQLQRRFNRMSQNIKTEATDEVQNSADNIVEYAKEYLEGTKPYPTVDTGGLLGGFTIDYDREGMEATISNEAPYAKYVISGRKPGSTPPPSSALEGWADRKGMPGAEFIIARSIGEKGIPPKGFMHEAFDREKQRFKNAMRNVVRREAHRSA